MRSLEWIAAENEKFNRPETQPEGEPFVVTAQEAADIYRGWGWCAAKTGWVDQPGVFCRPFSLLQVRNMPQQPDRKTKRTNGIIESNQSGVNMANDRPTIELTTGIVSRQRGFMGEVFDGSGQVVDFVCEADLDTGRCVVFRTNTDGLGFEKIRDEQGRYQNCKFVEHRPLPLRFVGRKITVKL